MGAPGADGAGGRGKGGGGGAGCWGGTAVPAHPTLHGIHWGRGRGLFLCLFRWAGIISPAIFLGALHTFRAEGKGELAASRVARTADRKTG